MRVYICNGNESCRYRKDGKKNQYCYANGGDEVMCKHTCNIKNAKYSVHKNFEVISGNEWEVEDA